MQSVRQQLPDLQNLDIQLNQLENAVKKAKDLKKFDKCSLMQLGAFSPQLSKFKKEIFRADNPEIIDKIINEYKNIFTINGDVEYKKEYSLAEYLGDFFFLIGTLGKIYDFTYGLGAITSILGWASIALGLCMKGIARMVDSTDLHFKKLEKIEEQIKKPLYQIINKEKIPVLN